ncbi:MAG: S-layer homology domain-containing protein [Candidatus Gracilibacteria bacterium]|nr:S-layer homology domain-containing protein [Candidatus Gracilibacteria bacterium]
MKNFLSHIAKRFTAFTMALVLALSSTIISVPQTIAQGAPGALNFSFNTPNTFPAQPVSFTINDDNNGGAQQAFGNDIFGNNAFPSGDYTVNVTNMPAGFSIIAGANYSVATANSAQLTLAPGGNQLLLINIAQNASILDLDFSTPATFPAQPVSFTVNDNNAAGNQIASSNDTLLNNAFPAGDFTVNVTNMPAGFAIAPGNNYTVASSNSATFSTVVGGNLDFTINITQNSSILEIDFNRPAMFPVQPIIFTVNDNNNAGAQVAASNNDLINNAFPAGDFTVNITNMPAGFAIAPGNNYAVASSNSATFTTVAGGNLDFTINIAQNSADLTFNFNTPGTFPAQPVSFSITDNNGGAQVAAGDNMLQNNAFPLGDFTVTITNMPAGFIITPGNTYTVASTNTATFSTTAGGNLNFTINIVQNSGTVNLSFNRPGNFPAQPIAFIITDNNGGAQVAAGNDTLLNTAIPTGDFTITLTNLPAGFNIGANAGYTATGPNSATFSVVQGQVLNLGVNILDGSSGTGALQFNLTPATQTVAYTITGQNTGTTVAGTNTFNNNALPADTYTIAFSLPGAQVIQAGAGFTASGKSVSLVLNAGDNLNFTFNIVGNGGGGGSRRRRNRAPSFFATNDNKNGTPFGDSPVNYTVFTDEAISITLTATDMNMDDNLKLEFINDGSKAGNKAIYTPHIPPMMQSEKKATLTWTPMASDIGETVFTFKASDDFEATAEYSIVVNVVEQPTNKLPTITFSTADGAVQNPLHIKKGSMNLDLMVTAKDENTNQLLDLRLLVDAASSNNKAMFSITNPPVTDFLAERGFNPANGRFQWMAKDAAASADPYKFVFQVISGLDTVMVTLNIFISENGNVTIAPPTTPPTTPRTVTPEQPNGGGGSGGGGGGGVNQRVPFPDDVEGNENLTDEERTALQDKIKSCQFRDNKTESVVMLCVLGVINGPTSTRNFSGEKKNQKYFGREKITRAAFTKMMVNITYQPSKIERVAKLILENNVFAFPDVDPITWFAQFIAIAKINNQVHGYSNGDFIPWNNIERSEAFKILINTAARDNSKIRSDLDLAKNENDRGPWFAAFDQVVNMYGGFKTAKSVNPGITLSKKMSRQEAADVIYTTIRNAGIDAKSQLAQLKQALAQIDALSL